MESHSILTLLFSLIQKYMTFFNSIHIILLILLALLDGIPLTCNVPNTILILQIFKVLF